MDDDVLAKGWCDAKISGVFIWINPTVISDFILYSLI